MRPREVYAMLSENEEIRVIQCAARRDEETAKRIGGEYYEAYKEYVKEMEENKKKGLKTTYDVPYDY